MQLTENSIRYTLSHLSRVAFPSLETTIFIEKEKLGIKIGDISVTFFLMNDANFSDLIKGNLKMENVSLMDGISVPLYKNPIQEYLYSVDNQRISIECDLLTLPFLLLSRREEIQRGVVRDQHGRFQYAGSVSEKYDLMDVPLADAYALLVRQWVTSAFPSLRAGMRKSHCISTHDVDILTRFGSPAQNIRTLAADLLKYHSFKLFHKSFKQFRAYRKNFSADPYILACQMLHHTDIKKGWKSLFFIKAQTPNEYDCTYDIYGKEITYLIDYLKDSNIDFGLHSGYLAACDEHIFLEEKSRLERASGLSIKRNRQHFLRFNYQQTLRCWQLHGITDDYTLGYAEREGFRCGTCHPYPIYDLANDCPTHITEHPLIAMDMTFIQYRQWQPEQSMVKIKELQEMCEKMEGDFILLWHNTNVWRQYEKWYEAMRK